VRVMYESVHTDILVTEGDVNAVLDEMGFFGEVDAAVTAFETTHAKLAVVMLNPTRAARSGGLMGAVTARADERCVRLYTALKKKLFFYAAFSPPPWLTGRASSGAPGPGACATGRAPAWGGARRTRGGRPGRELAPKTKDVCDRAERNKEGGAGVKGFIRVSGNKFVDDGCGDFVPVGWNSEFEREGRPVERGREGAEFGFFSLFFSLTIRVHAPHAVHHRHGLGRLVGRGLGQGLDDQRAGGGAGGGGGGRHR